MIVPDINLLVYAHNEASRFHAATKRWWLEVLGGDQPVGLCWATVTGFVRIVSHPAIQTNPVSVEDALAMVDTWIEHPNVHWLHPGGRHYDLFRSLLIAAGVGGNLVTDAHLAALAIEHQCELHSNDADFAAFSGLRWLNPIA
jgi:uncharacterized protein